MYILYMYAVCKAHKQLYWGEIYINCTYLKLYDLTCIYACETNITIRILNASITPKSDLTTLIIPPSSSPPTPPPPHSLPRQLLMGLYSLEIYVKRHMICTHALGFFIQLGNFKARLCCALDPWSITFYCRVVFLCVCPPPFVSGVWKLRTHGKIQCGNSFILIVRVLLWFSRRPIETVNT